jgi:putative addiction module killer protein
MEPIECEIRIYRTAAQRVPYSDWIQRLRDTRARQKIQARIARLRLGNLGHARSVGEGVFELKVDYGPGYRIYFGQDGPRLVIILCAGDKSTHGADIRAAKLFWSHYKQEKKHAHG